MLAEPYGGWSATLNGIALKPLAAPVSGWAQFMFGASVATTYGVLMLFNVVYTLFFAVTIVCLSRGLYWIGKWALEKRRGTATAAAPAAAPVLQAVAR